MLAGASGRVHRPRRRALERDPEALVFWTGSTGVEAFLCDMTLCGLCCSVLGPYEVLLVATWPGSACSQGACCEA